MVKKKEEKMVGLHALRSSSSNKEDLMTRLLVALIGRNTGGSLALTHLHWTKVNCNKTGIERQ